MPSAKISERLRFVTAASLFDGHDAAINVMRRLLQQNGVEVIHLGHNRSVEEIVRCAIDEDVHGIAVTSYQGGHNEFFRYMFDMLRERGASEIKIFGGGGGTILPQEIRDLMNYGISRIYSPDDGRSMGLQGMILDVISRCTRGKENYFGGKLFEEIRKKNRNAIARAITLAENGALGETIPPAAKEIPVVGITGTGGAGKSSLTDELLSRLLEEFSTLEIAVISVDPSKRKTGGALLGDRIRMNSVFHPRVYMRSLATREANLSLNRHVATAIEILKLAGYDLVIVETAGIGQSDSSITDLADVSLYVMTPEYGAASQLEKIDMLDFADLIAVNKSDKRGAADALRDVRKQVQRARGLFNESLDAMPVFATIASHFNDPGLNTLYRHLLKALNKKGFRFQPDMVKFEPGESQVAVIVPPERSRYLSEIAAVCREADRRAAAEAQQAAAIEALEHTIKIAAAEGSKDILPQLEALLENKKNSLLPETREILNSWATKKKNYLTEKYKYTVRGSEIQTENYTVSLSGTRVPKVAVPRFTGAGDIVRWVYRENFPGEFPFTAGVFPFKRTGEEPTRMFAGEGNPERTNRRFHYLSRGMGVARLSTAFDSVTLYGEDPDWRPDIYGKIGNSGVSIATLDDMKKLYSGFDLCEPSTSVSMTINGPAPMILAFFLVTATDQQCEKYIRSSSDSEQYIQKINSLRQSAQFSPVYSGELPEGHNGLGLLLLGLTGDQVLPRDIYENIKKETLAVVRGTVQADILKEDQAQNTCIFSTEFALRMMGDIQEYFTANKVTNFYSVSISGYHIAEAGANPITQVAFTLANGFTFVEYYLARGLKIDDFAANLSFFFSNGLDPEYAVIGRAARRIWARAMKFRYGANERSQKLKYHIQTSGRSLHAQEIAFNDIRTTLQALYAIYDNCNSLHTNAYDEAITTPTEESVRRAVAIQLIINRELGLARNENPLQGSFIIEELTDLVEEAILAEFERLSERGGVLGAMELGYQRNKIQEESAQYEQLKHNGKLPIIGVNTFLSEAGSPTQIPPQVIRSTEVEKNLQINNLKAFHEAHAATAPAALDNLKKAAVHGRNIFEEIFETCKVCSLGQMTAALYAVGGRYRRSM